jgi:F-type H+-transporting ATPase subunit delta
MVSVAATRYAKALADVVATSALDAAEVLSQLRSMEALIGGSADLRNALASPAVAPSRKRAVLARLLEPMNVLREVRNFTFIVSDHRRTPELASIVEAFERRMDEQLGYVRADVSSAAEISDAQKAALESQLSRLSGRKARLQFTTDPSLVAGVVARVGSTVYDGSARGQLERLRIRLGAAGA